MLMLKNNIFLKSLYRQISSKRLQTIQCINQIVDRHGGDLFIYNKTETVNVKHLLEVFEYAYRRYGVTVFFIDSFMKCNVCEEDYRGQKLFIDALCDFKNKFSSHIHLVTHPRKASDESGMPNKFDIKGTGAITDLADNCFTLWRNKPKEDEIAKMQDAGSIVGCELLNKPDAVLGCWKQRNGEWEGKIPLWFDAESCQFLDSRFDTPKNYLNVN